MIFFGNKLCDCGRQLVTIGQDKCLYCCFEEGIKEVSAYIYNDKTTTDNKTIPYEGSMVEMDDFAKANSTNKNHVKKEIASGVECTSNYDQLQMLKNKLPDFIFKTKEGIVTVVYSDLVRTFTIESLFDIKKLPYKYFDDLSKTLQDGTIVSLKKMVEEDFDHVDKLRGKTKERRSFKSISELKDYVSNEIENTLKTIVLNTGSMEDNNQEEEMKTRPMNIYDVITQLRLLPEKTLAVTQSDNGECGTELVYVMLDKQGDNLVYFGDTIPTQEEIEEHWTRSESPKDEEGEVFLSTWFNDWKMMHMIFEIVEEKEEWVECENIIDAYNKRLEGFRVRGYIGNHQVGFNYDWSSADDMIYDLTSTFGRGMLYNESKLYYLKK